MTARPGRRRRTTQLAVLATIIAVVATTGLAVGGGLALYHSTDGSSGGDGIPELVFPSTPTALLAGVDEDGALASLTVVVGRPGGAGGSVIPVPVSADESGGQGDEPTPVAETFASDGPDSVSGAVESLLGITIDVVEVADAARVSELLAPVGAVEVSLADDVTGAGGDVVAPNGTNELSTGDLAALLTARDADMPALEQLPAAQAAWLGVEDAVGDGLDGVAAGPAGSFADVLNGVLAGSVRSWAIRATTVGAADNPSRLDVSQLDQIELLLLFGQIAPGKVGAPNPALTFRVVAPFSAAQLAEHGWSNADVAYQAIATIQFLRGNVVSVDTTPAEASTSTRVELADPAMVVRGAERMFGDVEIVAADERIVGVDAVVVLGTAFLDRLAADGAESGASVSMSADAGVGPVTTDRATGSTDEPTSGGSS